MCVTSTLPLRSVLCSTYAIFGQEKERAWTGDRVYAWVTINSLLPALQCRKCGFRPWFLWIIIRIIQLGSNTFIMRLWLAASITDNVYHQLFSRALDYLVSISDWCTMIGECHPRYDTFMFAADDQKLYLAVSVRIKNAPLPNLACVHFDPSKRNTKAK